MCYFQTVPSGVSVKDYFIVVILIDTMFFPNFRWKGENVATTEVTEILGLVDFIQEVNVYGVAVPGMFLLRRLQNKIQKAFENFCSHLISHWPIVHRAWGQSRNGCHDCKTRPYIQWPEAVWACDEGSTTVCSSAVRKASGNKQSR